MTEGEKQILRVAQDDHIGVLPGLPEGEKRDEIAGVRRQKTKSNDAGSPIRSGMTEVGRGKDRGGKAGRTDSRCRWLFSCQGKERRGWRNGLFGGVVCHGLFAIRYPTVMPSRPPRHHPASTSVG